MKRLVSISFAYALAALAGGVFYREFTKFNDFSGRTALAFVHTHLFLLGMVVLLLAALFALRLNLAADRRWRAFLGVYNAGVCLTSVMLLVRGVLQVRMIVATPAVSGMISGLAGLGHILTGAGLVLFFLVLRKAAGRVEDAVNVA